MINLQEPGLIEYIGESVLIIGHYNADPDAVGAAQGVKELVEKMKPGSSIRVVMPNDISKLSTQIIETLDLSITESYTDGFDTLILVDTGGLNQIGEYARHVEEHKAITVLIDHHTLDPELTRCVDLLIHDEDVSSASELVYRLYKQYRIQPSVQTSKALIAGIAFDTKFFSIGDSETYQTVSELLDPLKDISEVLSLFRSVLETSERIARIKTAQRAELHRIHGYIIVFSEVGSYQASGARALINLGADLAVVVGEEKTSLRASLRSTQGFFDSTGVHLGELVSKFAEAIGGSGSGHPTAAGYNGSGSYDDLKKGILVLLSEHLG